MKKYNWRNWIWTSFIRCNYKSCICCCVRKRIIGILNSWRIRSSIWIKIPIPTYNVSRCNCRPICKSGWAAGTNYCRGKIRYRLWPGIHLCCQSIFTSIRRSDNQRYTIRDNRTKQMNRILQRRSIRSARSCVSEIPVKWISRTVCNLRCIRKLSRQTFASAERSKISYRNRIYSSI